MLPLTEIFCYIDDFCKHFDEFRQKKSISDGVWRRKRVCILTMSEVMTIMVMFHMSHYRTLKDFYINCLTVQYKWAFPKLVSYNRFVELQAKAFIPLAIMMMGMSGKETRRYYVDSTKLAVCHNLRIKQNKVFRDIAKRSKTTTGWFYGFKLHLIINDQGELMSFRLTPGNKDDRSMLEELTKRLNGWLFGDKGYLGEKITHTLKHKGIELITNVKKNMKQAKPLTKIKAYLLGKRRILETAIGQLKVLFHIDQTRHRSVLNFQVNVLSGLLAYVFKPKKVGVKFSDLHTYSSSSITSLMSN